jgi:hypothetical protein
MPLAQSQKYLQKNLYIYPSSSNFLQLSCFPFLQKYASLFRRVVLNLYVVGNRRDECVRTYTIKAEVMVP